MFWAKYPDADKEIYGNLLKRLSELQITPDVGQGIVAEQKRRIAALKLPDLGFKVAQGFAQTEDLEKYYADNFGKDDHTAQALPLNEINLDLEELIAHTYAETGLRWRLNCLNRAIGSLRPGDFGFIFARPETGKTTFLASEVSGFLRGCQVPIVWFNNEEQGDKVGIRLLQAYFGVTLEVLRSNPRRFKEQFLAETQGRLRLFDAALIDRRDVERIVRQVSPGLVIYDQIDKIRGFANDREDLRLGAIYQWARELAKGSHASIGVSQADGTAEGVRYLTMEHVANAKTAVQAEADWILGIGKTHSDGFENVRFLNISKNKLLGDADSIPELKHGRFDTLIEPTIARYKDIIKYE